MRSLAAALLCSSAAAAQTIYRWTDKQGEVHYSDDRSGVPAGAKLETTEGEELMVVPAPPRAAPPKPALPPARGVPLLPVAKKQSGPVEVHLAQVNVAVSDADRAYIEDSLRTAAASPRLATWGGLRESVEVEIAPAQRMVGYVGSDAFGMAVGTNRMLLRAPKDTRSMGRPLDYAGTALHELAHILEHQLAGPQRPRWFAEGFASVVAENDRASSIDDVAWWVIHEGGKQPLDALFTNRCDVHLAYAIAKEAVRYLVEVVAESGVRQMFELRATGVTFETAFSKVAGFTVGDFQARFIESLRPKYYDRAR